MDDAYIFNLKQEAVEWENFDKALKNLVTTLKPVWRYGNEAGGYVFLSLFKLLQEENFNFNHEDMVTTLLVAGINPSFVSRRKVKKTISPALRLMVYERDSHKCKCCNTGLSLSVDHIYPESKGGETVLDNLQTLCVSCNRRKGVK
jgi:hypothetical protein